MSRRSSSKGQISAMSASEPASANMRRHLAGPAHVLGAVAIGEAEVGVQPVAQVVPVEQEGGPARAHERLLHAGGQRRLARPGQAR